MKKINVHIIKELIISILIVLAIALLLSVLFYDRIALTKIIPQSEDYELSEEMQQDIANGILEESKQVVTSYYIDAADLKKYEKTKEYNKGKVNPFAAESNALKNSVNNNEIIDNSNNDTSSNNTTNFFEDEGIK